MLVPEKDLADVICHGLKAIEGIRPELEVTFDSATARRQLVNVRYDLLVLGRARDDESLSGSFTGLDAETVGGLPVILVGGRPNGHPVNPARVPLPLSFNLLR